MAVVVSHYRALFSLFVCFTLAPPKVNQWDRLLMENAERITDLNGEVERVKADQQVVSSILETIRCLIPPCEIFDPVKET